MRNSKNDRNRDQKNFNGIHRTIFGINVGFCGKQRQAKLRAIVGNEIGTAESFEINPSLGHFPKYFGQGT